MPCTTTFPTAILAECFWLFRQSAATNNDKVNNQSWRQCFKNKFEAHTDSN